MLHIHSASKIELCLKLIYLELFYNVETIYQITKATYKKYLGYSKIVN